jgi:hypothetical protein
MSEQRAQYTVKEPNPAGIPARWLRFLYRVAKLEAGRVYTLTLIVPSQVDAEPTWAISGEGKIENGNEKRAMFLGQQE